MTNRYKVTSITRNVAQHRWNFGNWSGALKELLSLAYKTKRHLTKRRGLFPSSRMFKCCKNGTSTNNFVNSQEAKNIFSPTSLVMLIRFTFDVHVYTHSVVINMQNTSPDELHLFMIELQILKVTLDSPSSR
jgi:hypothetical protein